MSENAAIHPAVTAEFSLPFSASFYLVVKRVIDFVLVLIVLPVALPVLLVLAVAVKLSGPGPVLLRLQAAGLNGRSFSQFRFRIIHTDAALRQYRARAAGEDTVAVDPRLTGIGRLLVRSRLNALPQLLNVLLGDMALVGPAAVAASRIEAAAPVNRLRLRVRPGIFTPESLSPDHGRMSEADRNAIALAYAAAPGALVDMRILGAAVSRFLRAGFN